ncbi:hypothetical protein OAT67_09660, partial [Bacteriovoracaceae bacterium]|nr:hypothetical protein [Bacteriovoracaceae bacterium]
IKKEDNFFVEERLEKLDNVVKNYKKRHAEDKKFYVNDGLFFTSKKQLHDLNTNLTSPLTGLDKQQVTVLWRQGAEGIESPQNLWILGLLKEIEKAFGINIDIVGPDYSNPNWITMARENKSYDLRVSSVDTGTRAHPWLIEMMFCGKFGVSFPDLDDRICDFTKSNFEMELEDFEKNIENLFKKNIAVQPLFFDSMKKIISKNISASQLPKTELHARFENIELE